MTDREKLIELINEAHKTFCEMLSKATTDGEVVGLVMNKSGIIADHLIANGVTVQKRGEWVKGNDRPKTYIRVCTACGKEAYFCGIGCSYKYCPNCGADMRKEKTNDTCS